MRASRSRALRRRATRRLSMVEKGSQRGHGKPSAMYGLRSAEGRTGAAILVLLVLLGSVAAVAAWRARAERAIHQSLEQRAAVVVAIEKARAEFLRGDTVIAAAVFAEDAIPFIDSYRQADAEGGQQLLRARVELTALGDTDAIAALDSYIEQLGQPKARVDAILSLAATADVSTRIDAGQQQYAPLWAETQTELAELDELANVQEAALATEMAAADSTAESAFELMLGLSALVFLAGTATVSWLLMSVVRPLVALRTSARAVAAGDLETRASVAGPEEVASLARDFNEMVAKRGQAEEALRESEAKYRGIFESIQDVFYRTDAEGIVIEMSPSVERLGYTREQLVGTQVLGIYEDLEERSGLLKALLEQGEVTDYEIRLKTGDGRLANISVSAHALRGPDGTLVGTEGTLRDISDRKAAEEARHEQARRDSLTGVLNHGAIVSEIRSLISIGEQAAPWALAMIDVDHLKGINDTYGHQVGDAVLVAVVAALSRDDALVGRYGDDEFVAVAAALSRDDALVGRYGGDEFVAILPGADRAAAEGYRSKATDALADATVTDPQTGVSVRAEASIGLAIYPEDGSTLTDLIKVADAAMYAVKRQRPVRRRSPRKHAPGRKAA